MEQDDGMDVVVVEQEVVTEGAVQEQQQVTAETLALYAFLSQLRCSNAFPQEKKDCMHMEAVIKFLQDRGVDGEEAHRRALHSLMVMTRKNTE